MGEVSVTVHLTNTGDMPLVRRHLMRPEAVRAVEATALIDTGAVPCVLPSLVVELLGLARPTHREPSLPMGGSRKWRSRHLSWSNCWGDTRVQRPWCWGMPSSSDRPCWSRRTSPWIAVSGVWCRIPRTLTSRDDRSHDRGSGRTVSQGITRLALASSRPGADGPPQGQGDESDEDGGDSPAL